MKDLQVLMLEEMSQTWEPAYLRFMDLKRGDQTKFPHYDKWEKEIVDRVAGWFKIIYNLRNTYQAKVVSSDRLFQQEYEMCAHDSAYFINTHLWIHEPRMTSYKLTNGESMSPMLPFVMYEGQERVVKEMELCYDNKIDFIIAKSREAGISWASMAMVLHKWLFSEGFIAGIASEKQEKVDSKGSGGPLFGKIRYMLYNLPNKFRPVAYRHNKARGTSGENNRHDTLLKLINPDTKSEIIGQTGDSIGEGYRFSIFLIDEEQNLSNPANVDRALESTTNCRGGIGTSRGMNHFGQKWASGAIHKISVMWHEDPRKVGKKVLKLENGQYTGGKIPYDSWWRRFTEEKLKDKPEVLAQAYDMDWNASVTDLCIEPKWIQAAVGFDLPPGGNDDNVAGFDVAGGGSNSSVYQQRIGNKLLLPREIRLEEVTRNMWQAHQYAVDDRVRALHYDKQAIGESMYGLIMDSGIEIPYQLVGVLGNSPASKRLVDDEGQSANDMYGNVRSEIWHKMRRLFRNTYEHVNGVREFGPDELISIPNHPKLIEQLAYPKRHARGGRWFVESKKDMAARGLKSPDFGDAAGYCTADVTVASKTTLAHFSRSTKNGHYQDIDVRPEQYGWQYTGAIFHNSLNEVSAVLARWNYSARKVEFVDEYISDSPLPKELKLMFGSRLSEINAGKIVWITQESIFKDLEKGDYQLHYMYQEAGVQLTYNYGENQKAALLTADKMFEANKATVSRTCRQLVAQLSGIEVTPTKVDERFGLVNAFLLIVQNLKTQHPNTFDTSMEKTTRREYQARSSAQQTALEHALSGQSV
jgi:hypothetical protein